PRHAAANVFIECIRLQRLCRVPASPYHDPPSLFGAEAPPAAGESIAGGRGRLYGGRSIMSFERKVFVATLASLGVIAFGGAHANAAQQDAAASQPTSEPQASSGSDTGNKQSKEEELVQTLETITVTGYTRSVETSVDLQRFSDGIENVITAADI